MSTVPIPTLEVRDGWNSVQIKGKWTQFCNCTFAINSYGYDVKRDAKLIILDCTKIGGEQEHFRLIFDSSTLNIETKFIRVFEAQKPKNIDAKLYHTEFKNGRVLKKISDMDDKFVKSENNKVFILSEPGLIKDPVQNLNFYIVEGGQIIPGGIDIEMYDTTRVNFIWNGEDQDKKQNVILSNSKEELKKEFMDYLSGLQGYNQGNFGASLCAINNMRDQMHRQKLLAKGIQMGAMNVIGDYNIGKSVTAKFWGKYTPKVVKLKLKVKTRIFYQSCI